MQPLRALVFDACGTLVDVRSVIALCEELRPGKGATLSGLRRTGAPVDSPGAPPDRLVKGLDEPARLMGHVARKR